MTKDERLLLELYRASKEAKESVDPILVAKRLGYKDNLIKELLKGLCKANLIKLNTPNEAIVTERGEQVAQTLL